MQTCFFRCHCNGNSRILAEYAQKSSRTYNWSETPLVWFDTGQWIDHARFPLAFMKFGYQTSLWIERDVDRSRSACWGKVVCNVLLSNHEMNKCRPYKLCRLVHSIVAWTVKNNLYILYSLFNLLFFVKTMYTYFTIHSIISHTTKTCPGWPLWTCLRYVCRLVWSHVLCMFRFWLWSPWHT